MYWVSRIIYLGIPNKEHFMSFVNKIRPNRDQAYNCSDLTWPWSYHQPFEGLQNKRGILFNTKKCHTSCIVALQPFLTDILAKKDLQASLLPDLLSHQLTKTLKSDTFRWRSHDNRRTHFSQSFRFIRDVPVKGSYQPRLTGTWKAAPSATIACYQEHRTYLLNVSMHYNYWNNIVGRCLPLR